MIQRKQTIFLIIALSLTVAMIFMPLVTSRVTPSSLITTAADGTITKTSANIANEVVMNVWGLYYDGVKQVDFSYFLILIFLTNLAIIATILLYKRRLLQIKLCYITGIFFLGIMIFNGIYFYKLNEIFTISKDFLVASNYSLSLIFPIVSLVMVWFAYKGIVKDEALVKSLDRIR